MKKLIIKLIEGWIYLFSSLEIFISKMFLKVFTKKTNKVNNIFRLTLMSAKEDKKHRKFAAEFCYECMCAFLKRKDDIVDNYMNNHKKETRHFNMVYNVMDELVTFGEMITIDWD